MTDFFGRLKSGAGKVAFEAEKMGRLNHAQSELAKIKSQIEEQFYKLGQMYYNQQADLEAAAPAFAETCQVVAGLEQQANLKAEEVQRINAEVYNPQGTTPAPQHIEPPAPVTAAPSPVNTTAPVAASSQTKTCPSCGREMALTVKFCPDCGTKTS